MNILESVNMAVKTLTANKLRSTLTMLGIIIGNASVIAMVGVGQGAQRYAAEQFESLGPNVLFIIPGSDEANSRAARVPRDLTLEDAEAIAAQVMTVNAVAPELQGQQPITYRNRRTNAGVTGTVPEFTTVRSFNVERGRFFSDLDVQRSSRVVALGADLARKLFGETDPIGQSIRIRNVSFQVIGVMESKGAFLGNNQDDVALIPISTQEMTRPTAQPLPIFLPAPETKRQLMRLSFRFVTCCACVIRWSTKMISQFGLKKMPWKSLAM